MAGHRPWSKITHKVDAHPDAAERRERSKRALDEEIAAHERSLAELRRARAFTQTTLAQALGVSQAQVSRIEHQADLYLSTLANYLHAMGGRLELVGVFDGETRVTLALNDLTARACQLDEGAREPAAAVA